MISVKTDTIWYNIVEVIFMRRLTEEEVNKRISEKHNGAISMIAEFTAARNKALFRCGKCSEEWRANVSDVYTKSGCPNCAGNIKKTSDVVKKEIFDLVGNEYDVLGDYINTHEPILFRHNECGLEFTMSPKAFITSGQRCPNERYARSAKSNGISFEKTAKELEENGKGQYEIIADFTFKSRKAKILHLPCNRVFNCEPGRLIRKEQGCPFCYSSKGEDAVREWLVENGYEFEEQYKIKSCKNIKALPFDFCVKTAKGLLLIEYDGEQHFKPKFGLKNFAEIQLTDSIKNQFCKDNNITLIRISYKRTHSYRELKKYVYNSLDNAMTIPSQA